MALDTVFITVLLCVIVTLTMTSNVKKKYKFVVIAVDAAIFTIDTGKLRVLLIKMKKAPFAGCWALPGGLIKPDESIDDAVRRHLHDKTGLKNVYLAQLSAFGKVDRDPFGRVVSVAYSALIPLVDIKLKTTEEYGDIRWFKVKKLPKLAYDHKEMITYAIKQLKQELPYTSIVSNLMPIEFSLRELQKTSEIILNKKLDKRNFIKKILALGIVQRAGKKRYGELNRPAELYKFVRK